MSYPRKFGAELLGITLSVLALGACGDKPLKIKGAELGASSLIEAARYGHNSVIQSLLEGGADVNEQRYTKDCQAGGKCTALIAAIIKGHVETARLLLDKGADPKLNDPLRWAIDNAPRPADLALAKLLIERGTKADPSYITRARGSGAIAVANFLDEYFKKQR